MTFQPEIYNDELFYAIQDCIKQYRPHFIVEIGSANGLGSTQAILSSMPLDSSFFGLESDPERYKELVENCKKHDRNIHLYNASSVPVEEFMTNKEILEFLVAHPEMNLSTYPVDTILGWREENIESLVKNKTQQNGIDRIINHIDLENGEDWRDDNDIVTCVLIDGSAFTGEKEMKKLTGSSIYILDDTQDIKNYDNYIILCLDLDYRIWKENKKYRNGYAIFVKKEFDK